ncbi:MAG: AMP-binding protein [Deltaproteobacteria bacterium]|nr:AMP-binding protein [Deltaproteobacteria bacterium]
MVLGAEVGMTLNYIIDSSCSKFKDKPAIGMAMEEPLTYQELYEQIIALAVCLRNEGIKKGDHVAVLGENSPNWGIAYLAIVRLGAIAVPILPDLPESDVHHILSEMQVRILFTTQRLIEKVYELSWELKGPVITLDDYEGNDGVISVTPFTDYVRETVSFLKSSTEDIVFPLVEEDDIASILYTSGTSGYSKAVMLSHKNLTSNAYAASGLMEIRRDDAAWLSILPMSHTYEFTCGFILPLLYGCRIAYAGKTPTPAILQKLCGHERPYVMFAVPLVLEKIYKKRVLPQIEKSWLLRFLCKTNLGRKFIYRRIGKKLLQFFGGRLALMGIGGAALNPEVERFLSEAGFPYLIGYGMTESSPLIAGGPAGDKTITIGSTGKPLSGVDVKIVEPDAETGIGEIYVRGANVMKGYYSDEEATAAVLGSDGWLATGDLGVFDDRGNLHVCGRSKNIIIMANGENIYPEAIEHKINAFNWVVESLVVENSGRLEAWIYPDYEFIDEQTAGSSQAERRAYMENLLDNIQKEINAQLSRSSRLGKVFERREPFIKTATHKIKRYLYDGQAFIG